MDHAETAPERAAATGNPALRLLTASFLMLFLELALIRWLGANVVHLSYFSNFVLLGSFLGIGAGFLISRKRWSIWPASMPLLTLLKHPLVQSEARVEWLEGVRLLDRALRGPRPAPGLEGLDRHLAEEGRDEAIRRAALAWWPQARALLAQFRLRRQARGHGGEIFRQRFEQRQRAGVSEEEDGIGRGVMRHNDGGRRP